MKSIHDELLLNEQFMQGVRILIAKKPRKKSILKAIEELNELSLKLLHLVNKGEDTGIDEELVDVQMHLILLQKLLPIDIPIITNEKVMKMVNSKDFKHYKSLYDVQ